MPLAFCPATGHYWEEPKPIRLPLVFQLSISIDQILLQAKQPRVSRFLLPTETLQAPQHLPCPHWTDWNSRCRRRPRPQSCGERAVRSSVRAGCGAALAEAAQNFAPVEAGGDCCSSSARSSGGAGASLLGPQQGTEGVVVRGAAYTSQGARAARSRGRGCAAPAAGGGGGRGWCRPRGRGDRRRRRERRGAAPPARHEHRHR